MTDTDVIILSAGNSTRSGMPKPFLLMGSGITFLEQLVNTYHEFGCRNIVLVLNRNLMDAFTKTYSELFRSKIKVVYNSKAELGRFYSLKLGADSIQDPDFCFVQNIDNPFTDLITLQKLFDNRKKDAYIFPVHQNKGGHPILIPKMIIEKIRNETDISLNTKDFLSMFNKIKAEVDNDKILANINTTEDYEFYFNKTV